MPKINENLLSDYGYQVVALPRTDISLLWLLAEEGKDLSFFSSHIGNLFDEDVHPEPMPDTATSDISGKTVLSLDVEGSLDFLSGIFKAMKLQNSELSASMKASKGLEVAFSFENVKEEKIDLLDLDNYLTGAYPKEGAFRTGIQKLKRSELYTIVGLLKSSTFSIDIGGSRSNEGELKTSIEKLAKAEGQVKKSGEYQLTMTVPDGAELVFGFQAVQIQYDKARWFEFWNKQEAGFTIKKQEGMVLRSEEDFPVSPLQSSDGMIDIRIP